MASAASSRLFFGVKAEGQQLEDIAKPLTAEEAEGRTATRTARSDRTGAPQRATDAAGRFTRERGGAPAGGGAGGGAWGPRSRGRCGRRERW